MKKIILLLLVSVLTIGVSFSQSLYTTEIIDSADVIIYLSNDTSQADLLAVQVTEPEMAISDGFWFFTDFKEHAMLRVFFTEDINIADIIVSYVEEDDDCGWINVQKRSLYRPKEQ